MPLLAGVFATEADLRHALLELNKVPIISEDIALLRPPLSPQTIQNVMPPVPPPPGVSNALPVMPDLATLASGSMENVRIAKEERERYDRIASEGATIAFVWIEPDKAEAAQTAMRAATQIDDLG